MITPKHIPFCAFFSVFVFASVALTQTLSSQEVESKPNILTSAAGFAVTWEADPEEEGGVNSVISKDGKVLSKVSFAKPISFSPDGTVLLMREAAADDDCRHYLLNLAKGEFKKEWEEGKELRIGSRYVVKAVWSEDGKSITLHNFEGIGGSDTIIVSAHCKQ